MANMTTIATMESLKNKVLEDDALPTIPVVAMKVLDLTQQQDVSVNDIASVVENDPALAAKILKMANSSMFGMNYFLCFMKLRI